VGVFLFLKKPLCNVRIKRPLCNVRIKYIPKIIHQLAPSKKRLHKTIVKNIDRIKKMNPDWVYVLYDDNDIKKFIKENYPPYILRIYNLINQEYGAARADFARYLIMYIKGGVYLDIKSYMTIPLTNIIRYEDEYILSHWGISGDWHQKLLNMKHGEYQQWHIICRPKHPFLFAVINSVIKNILNYNIYVDGTGKKGVLKVTGPIVYTQSIYRLLSTNKYRLVHNNKDIFLHYSCIRDHRRIFHKKHYSELKSPIIMHISDKKNFLYHSAEGD